MRGQWYVRSVLCESYRASPNHSPILPNSITVLSCPIPQQSYRASSHHSPILSHLTIVLSCLTPPLPFPTHRTALRQGCQSVPRTRSVRRSASSSSLPTASKSVLVLVMITFSADRMTSFFVILLLQSLWEPTGALLISPVKNDSCPTSGYVTKTLTVSDKRIGRKAYRLVTSHLSHHNARLNCANMGASLALPRIDAVRRLYSSASVWIMVSDATVENTWENTDTGEDLSFFNFAVSQPNGGTAENCVYIRLINGLWHDYNCGHGLWFVCEVPAP
ncbi:ladderlectin-like 3 [Homarus americanus]|uniref:Ladderlectin-like 3 n=1 Tax=Homarus americanus TaxID=6706 RepID=A0A8J5NDS3_HOMAM|nr:ladderlectin-like 3 [Homarus americanus]